MPQPRIRHIAICVFSHQGKILVNAFPDAVKQQILFRPLGIEFGERSADAIVREIREELGLPIHNVRLLGTLESLFTYLGKPGHEVVQVYDAQFSDLRVYDQIGLEGHESNGDRIQAQWRDSESLHRDGVLVPEGLHEMLRSLGHLE
jgi:8-oxo-dGTP pyrophosphatase MutT (NUDIX family)